MKRLALSVLSAAAVAAGTTGLAAPSASALVNYCSGPAATGCDTYFGGYRSYIDSYSDKSGDPAAEICTSLRSTAGTVVSGCSYQATYIRRCNPSPGTLVYGVHWGSSNAWTVNGRDATASDAVGC